VNPKRVSHYSDVIIEIRMVRDIERINTDLRLDWMIAASKR